MIKNIIKKTQLKETKFLFNYKWEYKYFFLKRQFRNKFFKKYLNFYKYIFKLKCLFKYYKFNTYFFKNYFQSHKYLYLNTKGSNINIRYNSILQQLNIKNIKYYNYIYGNIILSNSNINIELIYKFIHNIDNYKYTLLKFNDNINFNIDFIYDFKKLTNNIII